ncbi:hypothetical protein H0H81_001128 [Sphagnurus paluster]|uniref:Uncharacterized protein n=1 Tax=Sphagnurus paluster TaxID=117069 RepID=A0A9P7K2V4_9AGAR|nr:hypothetical protein H0H81_001128 [Sphagnurus paluster]
MPDIKNYPLDPGELRLRVTDSNDPASFEHGKDLLRPEGFAWCIKAATIASQSKPAFRDILLREGLISQHNMERCRKIGLVGMRPTLLYTLGQPFHIDVSTVSTRINFVCGDEKSNIILPYLFYDRRKSYSRHFAPFTGHILARFEFSPLPQHQDNDNPVLVVRILEILSPIECTVKKYDNYIRRPVAGTLHESGMGVYTIPLTKESKKNNRLRSWIESAMQ